MRRALVVLAVLAPLSALAQEADEPQFTKATYPRPLLERPLVLPDRMVQASLRGLGIDDATHPGGAQSFATAAADVGIRDVVQLGLAVTGLVSPDVDFGSVRANLQGSLAPELNGRIDVGFQNLFPPQVMVSATRPDSYAFVGGIGFVLKESLGRHFAITSGGPSPFRNDDDLLTWQVQSSRSYGLFGIPVGLLVQFHPAVALELRTGFRVTIGSVARQEFLPLGGELTITPARRFDVVVGAQLPGNVDDYTQVIVVQGFLQSRF